MKTLRECVLEMQERAIQKILEEIRRKGYITFLEAEFTFQEQISKFEKYYHERIGEPFSEAFVQLIFNEFYKKFEGIKGLKKKVLPPDKGTELIFGELQAVYAFNDEDLERGYRIVLEEGESYLDKVFSKFKDALA